MVNGMNKNIDITPAEREAKAKEFDRAAKEATRARDAYKAITTTAAGPQKRAAMRQMWSANIQAKEAAKQAALLRETQQQREEREAYEAIERKSQRPCPHCGGRGRRYSEAERIERIRTSALNRRAYWCGL